MLEVGLNRAVALIADRKGGRAAGPLKALGAHPADGKPVTVHNGRYGPYVKHGRTMASLPEGQAPEDATLEAALPLLEQKKAGGGKTPARKAAAGPKAAAANGRARKAAAGPLKALGAHPADGKPVTLHNGRFGPYVKHGRATAPLPKDRAPEDATLEAALPLLEQKKAAGGKAPAPPGCRQAEGRRRAEGRCRERARPQGRRCKAERARRASRRRQARHRP